jgi:hypothetical protein
MKAIFLPADLGFFTLWYVIRFFRTHESVYLYIYMGIVNISSWAISFISLFFLLKNSRMYCGGDVGSDYEFLDTL